MITIAVKEKSPKHQHGYVYKRSQESMNVVRASLSGGLLELVIYEPKRGVCGFFAEYANDFAPIELEVYDATARVIRKNTISVRLYSCVDHIFDGVPCRQVTLLKQSHLEYDETRRLISERGEEVRSQWNPAEYFKYP